MSAPESSTPPPPPGVRPIDPTARWKTIAVLAILAVVGLGVALDRGAFVTQQTRVAPDVVFHDRGGKTIHLSDYRGKIVLVNFWATWCPPCQEETPSFDRFAAKIAASHPDIAVVAASVDDDGWPAIDRFSKAYGVHALPIVLDDTQAAARFGTFKLPETWVVGRDGKILHKFVGAEDWDDPQVIPFLESLDKSGGAHTS